MQTPLRSLIIVPILLGAIRMIAQQQPNALATGLGKEFASETASVNGTTLHYVRGGKGHAIILIHGFPQDWFEYHAIMPRLAKQFTVIAVDLRGLGGSTATEGGYDAANMAEDIYQLTKALNLERVYIVGHDIGGHVAYAFVRRYPHATRGAMILDTPVPGVDGCGYGARNPALPYTPGSDAAGVVESAGADVDLKAGDRVYTTGTITGAYAEMALCKSSQVQSLPARVNFSQGAGVFVPYATAYRALFQLARIKPGETVLVHGASGGVGVAAIQFAIAAGIKIIGSVGSNEGLKLIKTEGAQHTVNHSSPDYQKQILDLTNGRGVDVIVEMLANVNLGHDLKMLAPHGCVVVVGSRGSVEINPRDLMTREGAVLGLVVWDVPDAEAAEIHAALQAGLGNGTLRPVIASELPLASAPEAHRRIMESGARGKIVLIP